MKNVIIAVLAIVSVVSIFSVSSMSTEASYWMNRCEAAEAVIERIEEDNANYVLDVLCESDEWSEWLEYCPSI